MRFCSGAKSRKRERSEKGPPVGRHSSITHLKIKSEQRPDRPAILPSAKSHTIDLFFFFLDKALKILGNSDGLSHRTVQILHTHSCWCPRLLSWKQSQFFSVFDRRVKKKKYMKQNYNLSLSGVGRADGAGHSSGCSSRGYL